MILGILASYFLVALLAFILGRIWAEVEHREADSWERLPEVDWSAPAFAYDWAQEGVFL